jgi:hypothetical protein
VEVLPLMNKLLKYTFLSILILLTYQANFNLWLLQKIVILNRKFLNWLNKKITELERENKNEV